MKKHAIIVGAGIGGLGTACLLGRAGYEVTVIEKNEQLGGRLSVLEKNGYRFDMGPSWYLMPDVFEHYFSLLDEKVSDHLSLVKLSPSHRIFFKDTDYPVTDFFADIERDAKTFEQFEPGSSVRLREYLRRSAYQYKVAVNEFMYKNYDSILDFLSWRMMMEGRKLSVFTTMDRYVSKWFSNDALKKIMQYSLVFLGSSPYSTPALYNIMSHVDFAMGVYYPDRGFGAITDALVNIGKKYGVTYRTSSPVTKILTENGAAVGVEIAGKETVMADLVISNADIHHTETALLAPDERSHSESYWARRTLAPSAFIMYLGVRGRVDSLAHHNLLFSKDWRKNFAEIFDDSQWPTDPSLYVCAPSKTDSTVAPAGNENLFVLVPIAPQLSYTDADLEAYGNTILDTLERDMGATDLKNRIEVKEYFCVKDFATRYNSQGGTALGLAHTLDQTAIFRPNNVSKKVANLYYVGANTNPGIGMPTCLISAELAYKRIVGDRSPSPLPTPIAQG